MNYENLNNVVHKLVSKQQVFKEYEKLAGNGFHFSPQTFRDCARIIQETIEIARGLSEEDK
jgi:hypothetical protein